MRQLRTTYFVVLTILALLVVLGLSARFVEGSLPALGYLLIGIWCIPGLYCFIGFLRMKPPFSLLMPDDDEPKRRNLLSWAVALPLVFFILLEIGPFFLLHQVRNRWFKDRWIRVGLEGMVFCFLAFALLVVFDDDRYPRSGMLLAFFIGFRAWLGL